MKNRNQTLRTLRDERGLTLIEIMVVIVILGILMTMVGINVLGQLQQAKVDATRTQMLTIKQAVTMFNIKVGRLPTTSEGIEALIRPPQGSNGQTFQPFLDANELPTDEWDAPYQYYAPAQGCQSPFEIRSLGADSAEGGSGADSDLTTCSM